MSNITRNLISNEIGNLLAKREVERIRERQEVPYFSENAIQRMQREQLEREETRRRRTQEALLWASQELPVIQEIADQQDEQRLAAKLQEQAFSETLFPRRLSRGDELSNESMTTLARLLVRLMSSTVVGHPIYYILRGQECLTFCCDALYGPAALWAYRERIEIYIASKDKRHESGEKWYEHNSGPSLLVFALEHSQGPMPEDCVKFSDLADDECYALAHYLWAPSSPLCTVSYQGQELTTVDILEKVRHNEKSSAESLLFWWEVHELLAYNREKEFITLEGEKIDLTKVLSQLKPLSSMGEEKHLYKRIMMDHNFLASRCGDPAIDRYRWMSKWNCFKRILRTCEGLTLALDASTTSPALWILAMHALSDPKTTIQAIASAGGPIDLEQIFLVFLSFHPFSNPHDICNRHFFYFLKEKGLDVETVVTAAAFIVVEKLGTWNHTTEMTVLGQSFTVDKKLAARYLMRSADLWGLLVLGSGQDIHLPKPTLQFYYCCYGYGCAMGPNNEEECPVRLRQGFLSRNQLFDILMADLRKIKKPTQEELHWLTILCETLALSKQFPKQCLLDVQPNLCHMLENDGKAFGSQYVAEMIRYPWYHRSGGREAQLLVRYRELPRSIDEYQSSQSCCQCILM